MDALGGGLDFARGEQLVDESLGGIAGGSGEGGLIGGGGDGIGVVCEEVAEIKGKRRGLIDSDRAAGWELAR